MKYATLLAASALALITACHGASSSSVSDGNSAAAPAARTAFPLDAALGDVRAAAAKSPASGLWTDVELKFQVPCSQKLETFSYNLRSRADGGTDLLVSAIATRPSKIDGVVCQSIKMQSKKVTIPGIIAKDDIHLVNLKGSEKELKATTKSLEPIGLELVSTRSLCPQGAKCIINGTIVTLRTAKPVSCIDVIAPVTFAAEAKDGNGKVKLAVSAINMVDSMMVRCLSTARTFDLSLPMVFADKADIDLTVVGGN